MKRGYVDTPEGQVHYLTEGSGEPLILLHQSPRSSRMYVKMIPLLSKDYQVFALDMLGYGNSDPAPSEGIVEYLGGNIPHVLDALGLKKAHLFGLHTGTGVAVEAAAIDSDRFQTMILFGFPLIETEEEKKDYFAVRETGGGISAAAISNDGSHLIRIWQRAYSEVLRYWIHSAHPPSDELYPGPLKSVHSNMTDDQLEFMDRWVLDFLQTKKHVGNVTRALFSYDFAKRFPLIRVPTLHIEPDSPYENYFCMRGEQLAKLIPNCEAVVMPDSDDNAAEFREKQLVEMIRDFLKKHPF